MLKGKAQAKKDEGAARRPKWVRNTMTAFQSPPEAVVPAEEDQPVEVVTVPLESANPVTEGVPMVLEPVREESDIPSIEDLSEEESGFHS